MEALRLDLMELAGPDYLADLLISAAALQWREDGYRIYVTDALAAIAGQLGVSTNRRYADIIHPKPEDTRKPEEIAASIIAGAGLIYKGSEE